MVISGHGDAKFSVGLGAGAGRDGLVVRHRVLNYRRYCGAAAADTAADTMTMITLMDTSR